MSNNYAVIEHYAFFILYINIRKILYLLIILYSISFRLTILKIIMNSIIILIGTTAFGALFTFFSYKTFQIYSKRRKYRHIPGPVNEGILGFYLGSLIELKKAEKNGIMIFDLFDDWY